jgi:hypothetical protein
VDRLADKVCVMTGAAGGIGEATAERLAQEGARVAGVDLLEHSVGELSLQADLTDEAQVRAVYAAVREELGLIDVLFNNAGLNDPDDGSALETTLETWNRVRRAARALDQPSRARPPLIQRGSTKPAERGPRSASGARNSRVRLGVCAVEEREGGGEGEASMGAAAG